MSDHFGTICIEGLNYFRSVLIILHVIFLTDVKLMNELNE